MQFCVVVILNFTKFLSLSMKKERQTTFKNGHVICRWYFNKRHLDYTRHKEELAAQLLPAIPAFGAAMLQFSR